MCVGSICSEGGSVLSNVFGPAMYRAYEIRIDFVSDLLEGHPCYRCCAVVAYVLVNVVQGRRSDL